MSSNSIYFYLLLTANSVSVGGLNTLPSLNLGGPPQHLISGPGYEPGVNEGLASLFFPFVTLSLIPFCFCLASSVNNFMFRRKLDKAIRACKVGDLSWCSNINGTWPFIAPLASPSMVAQNLALRVLRHLRFQNPDNFCAGSLSPSWLSLMRPDILSV